MSHTKLTDKINLYCYCVVFVFSTFYFLYFTTGYFGFFFKSIRAIWAVIIMILIIMICVNVSQETTSLLRPHNSDLGGTVLNEGLYCNLSFSLSLLFQPLSTTNSSQPCNHAFVHPQADHQNNPSSAISIQSLNHVIIVTN